MRDLPNVDIAAVRGWGRLAFDATHALTHVVEGMHHEIARAPFVFAAPRLEPTRGVTGLVYRSIRGTTRALGWTYDVALRQLEPASEGVSSRTRDGFRAAVNGVLGDHLVATRNPLAIPMRVRRNGRSLTLSAQALARTLPEPRRHVVILVHGLCMADLGWSRDGHDHGAALERDLGCSAVYLHYNSGLHISTSGRELGQILDQLVRAWPVPVDRLTLVGHSMGGLVVRSACHQAGIAGAGWLHRVTDLICLGTPHFGAPLARGVHWLHAGLGLSPYTAALALLGKLWSAGATDLRHGYLLDDDWRGREQFAATLAPPTPVPLPDRVRCFAVAGYKGRAGALLGDGLVPVATALGHHPDPGRALAFAETRRWVAQGADHFGLLGDAAVYDRLRSWIASG